MNTIYLVRHGQTLFNKQHKIQGVCDSPLTEIGIKQAKIAREHLDKIGIEFDLAYSSTSERACDTLEILTDISYKRMKALKEWNFGIYEGEGEYMNPPLPYGDFFVQFGGESQDEVKNRINDAILDIASKENNKKILIVSHGATIANFCRAWEHTSEIKNRKPIQNCSLFKFIFKDNKFKLEEIIEHDFSKLR